LNRVTLLWLILVLLPSAASAKTRVRNASVTDADYVAALAAVDHFLCAWQTQDHEAGLLMLTDGLKKHVSEGQIEQFFSAGSSRQEAYLIRAGKKLKAGRYSFPVALLQSRTGTVHRRFSEIVVLRTGKDDWAIDKLP
jgi:hypothetical protein